jgi:hypothetical protein
VIVRVLSSSDWFYVHVWPCEPIITALFFYRQLQHLSMVVPSFAEFGKADKINSNTEPRNAFEYIDNLVARNSVYGYDGFSFRTTVLARSRSHFLAPIQPVI